MPHHGPHAVAEDVAAQEFNVIVQEDPVPLLVRLNASHSRAMLALIGPSAQTTTHDGAPIFRKLPGHPRQLRGPMGEDAERNLVNHCIPRISRTVLVSISNSKKIRPQ